MARPSGHGRWSHPLSSREQNARLDQFERSLRARFEAVIPTLREVAGLRWSEHFAAEASSLIEQRLGVEAPRELFDQAWIAPLDMRQLFGVVLGGVIRQVAQDVHRAGELIGSDLTSFFLECGYHAVDISPCSDGRLKGVIRAILRLPDEAVRSRKAYAGAMFDVEASVRRWVETELMRFREGCPVPPEAGTRYLKVAVYHWSRSDPEHEGCAAHGSDRERAAAGALRRLREFREAVENSFYCGASVDILLIGVDTDADAIRVHVPDAEGDLTLDRFVDNHDLYEATRFLDATRARLAIYEAIEAASGTASRPHEGMRRLIATLLINNLSQIDRVYETWQGRYPDVGHNETFISVGDGFEEFQLRNLAYFVYLQTVEEAGHDLDVGIEIFRRLNVRRGLPIPIAIHFRYDRRVPGSRERATERCQRVRRAIEDRYRALFEDGYVVCDMSIQDRETGSPIEAVSVHELSRGHGGGS